MHQVGQFHRVRSLLLVLQVCEQEGLRLLERATEIPNPLDKDVSTCTDGNELDFSEIT